MYFLGIFQDIGDTIAQAFRSLMGNIVVKIYELIEYMYLLFNYLAKAEILDNSFITGIYQKVGMILGLFMIFKLTFSLIQSLINPDKLTDKKTGFSQIIMRCVIAIVLLGITPSLFREAFKIQNFIVGSSNKDNIIYKLVVGKNVTGDFESMGRVIASNLYFSFFTDEDNNLNKGIKDTIIESEANYYDRFRTDNYENLVADVENRNLSFSDTLPYLTIQENGKYVIEFDWLLSLLFGVVFLYLMFTYCIQVATRVIQLAYLQLIAPVPILSYISDPDGAFQKWLKQCATTFLDLFIRLAIIYFIMAIIDDVISQFKQASGIIFDSTGIPTDDHGLLVIVKIFIILGLLMFAKRVPELLKDLFPNFGGGAASLGFGLKNPKKMLGDIPGMGIAKGAATFGLGTVVGGVAGMATGIKNGEGFRGKLAGAFGGLGRGAASARTKGNIFKNAQNGMNSTRAARQRAYEKNHDGSTFWGRHVTSGGAARRKDELDRQIAANDAYANTMKLIEAETDKDARVISAQNNLDLISKKGRTSQAITVNGRTYAAGSRIAATDLNDAIAAAQKNVKNQRIACVEDVYNGVSTNGALVSLVNSAGTQVNENSGKGYDGFGSVTVSSGTGQIDYSATSTATSTDKAEGLFAYKSTAAADTGDIKNPGGSRHEEYERASANSKYNKTGK